MEYAPTPTSTTLTAVGTALGCRVSHVRRILGGQSATTDLLRAEDGTFLVLRRHGAWSIGLDDGIADREKSVLEAVRAAGVPAPEVLWAGPLDVGTAIITSFVEGEAILVPEDPVAWVGGLAETLVRLHSVAVGQQLGQQLTSAPANPVVFDPSPGFFEHARARELLARRDLLTPPSFDSPKLVHGDFWPGNVLWRGGEIAAVVDWEAAVLADPAADVAYCATEMHYLGLVEEAEQFVAAYRNGTDSSLEALDYWMVTAICRSLGELSGYLDGWRGLGHAAELRVVEQRQGLLIDRYLDG